MIGCRCGTLLRGDHGNCPACDARIEDGEIVREDGEVVTGVPA